jgi:crotonobetainyl-CoA:carnitine CoA-transferase CaiB-like acyl-CoA transferase
MELIDEIAPIIASRTAAEWVQFFIDQSIAGSPILELSDVVNQPHFAARGLLELGGESLPNVIGPARYIDHNGWRPGAHPMLAPSVGADTESVLRAWLGREPTGG